MAVRKLNIKNRTYCFYNDLINNLTFESKNLKLDKKHGKTLIFFYIGYIGKNKPIDRRVRSVNPLYLMFNKVFCSVGEKNGIKYLNIEKNHCDPALN